MDSSYHTMAMFELNTHSTVTRYRWSSPLLPPRLRLEFFPRGSRPGWATWGDQAEDYAIGWDTYAHNSQQDLPRWAEAAE